MFSLSFHNTILRYYLMMAVAIVAVYTWQMWLVVVTMIIGVNAILGISLPVSIKRPAARRIPLEPQLPGVKRKAG